MKETELKPSKPFPNGISYEFFLECFCWRCKKHKENERGYCAFVNEGGCPIENALEDARWGEPFPSEDIVEVHRGNEINCWHACTKFETDDIELMKKYNSMMGRSDNEQETNE